MTDSESRFSAQEPKPDPGPSTRPSLARVVRLVQGQPRVLLDQVALHGKLAWTEWLLERDRLAHLAAAAAACLGLAFMADALVCLLLTAASWNTAYRLPVIAMLCLVHLAGAGLAWHRCQALAKLGGNAFAASREELARDAALFTTPA